MECAKSSLPCFCTCLISLHLLDNPQTPLKNKWLFCSLTSFSFPFSYYRKVLSRRRRKSFTQGQQQKWLMICVRKSRFCRFVFLVLLFLWSSSIPTISWMTALFGFLIMHSSSICPFIQAVGYNSMEAEDWEVATSGGEMSKMESLLLDKNRKMEHELTQMKVWTWFVWLWDMSSYPIPHPLFSHNFTHK